MLKGICIQGVAAQVNLMNKIVIWMVDKEKVLHKLANWFIRIWRYIPNKDL